MIWKYKTGTSYWGVASSPSVVDGRIYVGSDDSYVYCLNKTTGKLTWKFKTGYWVLSSPAVSSEYVYIGSGDGHLYCIDKNNTKEEFFRYCNQDKKRDYLKKKN